MNCKFLAYILSQYLWFALLGLCLISTIQFKKPIPTGDIYSNSNAPYFNQSKDPIWFLHFTDIHISSVKNNYETILSRFNRSLSIFSPDHIVITGDIADNYRGNINPIYYQQMEADWKQYTQLLTDLDTYFNNGQATKNSKEIITDQTQNYQMNFLKEPLHVAGNHDIFNVLSFDSKKHFANGILYNKSTSLVSRVNFNENISFVKMNPFSFPSATSAIIWWISPNNKIRSEINSFLHKDKKPSNTEQSKNQSKLQQDFDYLSQQTILLGHIPSRMWFTSFSTTLSNEDNNVRIYLCGHLHPKKPQILHHGKSIEIVGTPLFRYNQIGLLAYDNGHFSYHQNYLDNEKFAILTYPNPDGMKSSLERFDEPIETMQVRAVSFSGDLNLSYQIDDGEVQRLECKKQLKKSTNTNNRYNDHIYLCTKRLSFDKDYIFGERRKIESNGSSKHTFTKLGDWSGNFTFTIGEKVDSFDEECYFDEPSGSFIACFFTYLVFLLIVSLPFSFVHFAYHFDDWLELEMRPHRTSTVSMSGVTRNSTTNNNQNTNIVLNGNLNWILATVGGFFVVESRITKSPYYIRILILISILWSFVFPFCFFKIEDKTAVYWLWGYIIGDKSAFMATPARFGCFYLVFVVTPYIIVVSGMQHTFSLFNLSNNSKKNSSNNDSGKDDIKANLNDNQNSVELNLNNDSSLASSDQIIGLGFDLQTVDKLTLFKRGCLILNCLDFLFYFSCFYKCYIYAKELAKDFGDLYGYTSFLFIIIPALLFLVLALWITISSVRIYRHRFDFSVSSLPLEKTEL